MICRNDIKGKNVYHFNLGCYGKLTGNTNTKNSNLVEVEFDNFFQYCNRKDLIEVEGVD